MGVKLNNEHTDQMGLIVEEVVIFPPEYETEDGEEILRFEDLGSRGVEWMRREINITMGAKKKRSEWRNFFAGFLNKYHGEVVELVCDDDTQYHYRGRCYVEKDVEKTARIGKFQVTIMADPFKYKDYVSVNVSESGTITAETNYETPCIIEITPLNDNTSLTITGVARDPVTGEDESVTVKNLKKGKTVILDGESCTVTQEGANKYPDTDFWEFPSLLPGENEITLSNTLNTVKIKYRPRYI